MMESAAMIPETNTADVQYFHPPNLLKLKVGDGRLDPEAIARAESAVQQLATDYMTWVMTDIKRLDEIIVRARDDGANRKTHLDALFVTVHDMKGQGGTFGYPLISRIGHSLCRLLERDGLETNLKVISAHVDAMKAVILHKVKGDGGAVGQQIAEGLEAAAAKLAAG